MMWGWMSIVFAGMGTPGGELPHPQMGRSGRGHSAASGLGKGGRGVFLSAHRRLLIGTPQVPPGHGVRAKVGAADLRISDLILRSWRSQRLEGWPHAAVGGGILRDACLGRSPGWGHPSRRVLRTLLRMRSETFTGLRVAHEL